MGVPLHLGTVKYFKEIGVEIPEASVALRQNKRLM